uniref:Uncharacterized protein n=1 Tax=Anguilla anguilla TaxID=7936 RepID=A0A0E9S7L4_ANGAN
MLTNFTLLGEAVLALS